MIAGNTKEDEKPSAACKHGVSSGDLNLKIFSEEKITESLFVFRLSFYYLAKRN